MMIQSKAVGRKKEVKKKENLTRGKKVERKANTTSISLDLYMTSIHISMQNERPFSKKHIIIGLSNSHLMPKSNKSYLGLIEANGVNSIEIMDTPLRIAQSFRPSKVQKKIVVLVF